MTQQTIITNPARDAFIRIMQERKGIKTTPAPVLAPVARPAEELRKARHELDAWKAQVKRTKEASERKKKGNGLTGKHWTRKDDMSSAIDASREAHRRKRDARMNQAREFISTLPANSPRPRLRDLARQFHIAEKLAGVVISERFGPVRDRSAVHKFIVEHNGVVDVDAVVQQFNVTRCHVQTLIRKHIGQEHRLAAKNRAIAFIDTLAERPNTMDIAQQFCISRDCARKVIAAKFGSETTPTELARPWLETLTERPTPAEVAQRFGVPLAHARTLTYREWKRRKANAPREAVAK